ncbi:MAG: AAA family ATPase [Candidatus Dojkabacteria bacterium]|nr:MAG: AAA family ATPase [Candidatus Dojkabacteria bacterium]
MDIPWFKYSVDYTWLSTKDGEQGHDHTFNLLDPEGRRLYFSHVVGKEIAWLREYLAENTFIAYMLAPKNAGKGTYTKGLQEALGGDYFTHVSVGDLVRAAEEEYRAEEKNSALYKYALENYRGYMHLDEVFAALLARTTQSLIPTEFVLTLIKRAIDSVPKKTVFVDGFPRNLDQVSYSLYFRELINYRQDPDIFVLINAPLTVLDERIKHRVICPECKTPRNMVLLPTQKVGYDEATKEFYLNCDQPGCKGGRMVKKEGDELGIEPIKQRIMMDVQLMERAKNLYGVPKIELFNALEADKALDYVHEYELTPAYSYSLNDKKEVVTAQESWVVEEHGVKYHSLLPTPVVVQLIKQLYNTLKK